MQQFRKKNCCHIIPPCNVYKLHATDTQPTRLTVVQVRGICVQGTISPFPNCKREREMNASHLTQVREMRFFVYISILVTTKSAIMIVLYILGINHAFSCIIVRNIYSVMFDSHYCIKSKIYKTALYFCHPFHSSAWPGTSALSNV